LLKHEQVFVLAHLAKGNVSLCHHFSDLASVVHFLLTFHILIFSTETSKPNEQNLCYKDCSFRLDPLTNMAATGNSCFWLVDL